MIAGDGVVVADIKQVYNLIDNTMCVPPAHIGRGKFVHSPDNDQFAFGVLSSRVSMKLDCKSDRIPSILI